MESLTLNDYLDPIKNQLKHLKKFLNQIDRRYSRKKYDKLSKKKEYEFSYSTRSNWLERKIIYDKIIDVFEETIKAMEIIKQAGLNDE
jgi:hypothetical protein